MEREKTKLEAILLCQDDHVGYLQYLYGTVPTILLVPVTQTGLQVSETYLHSVYGRFIDKLPTMWTKSNSRYKYRQYC